MDTVLTFPIVTVIQNSSGFNSLTPELNPSAQRCLTRFATGDYASWNVHFVNVCVKNQQMQQLFIQFINYMVFPTCFAITLSSSGSVPSAVWDTLNWEAVDRILWMGVLCLVMWCVRTTSLDTFSLLVIGLSMSGPFHHRSVHTFHSSTTNAVILEFDSVIQ
jgi:hypothetical protein